MQTTLQRGGRSGGALLISLVAAVTVAGLAASAYMLTYAQNREVSGAVSGMRAVYLAEEGISESIVAVSGALAKSNTIPTSIGTQAAPRIQRNGRWWCDIVDNANGSYTVTSTGVANLNRRSLEAVIEPVGGGIFDYAVFAGNSSLDPGYNMGFGGSVAQADDISGNVYSGGNISVTGDASISGAVDATGSINGTGGSAGIKRSLPNLVAMNYEANHDFDVAGLFGSATLQSSPLGGTAWEVPQDNPAHIFRRDPDDRTAETSSTAKADYFLEDPYESLTGFTAPSGGAGQRISLSGVDGRPGVSGTDKVYYIDGNLWIHNYQMLDLQIYNPDPEGAKVTLVVKGNIYISDNLFIDDLSKSGIAMLAINDANYQDSGNIYFGDPTFGTLEHMQAFMYAENNFYDYNLDASGSSTVVLDGNMTAGNHVDINRDFVDPNGVTQHSKLTVNFDNRISNGDLVLPGLPGTEGGTAGFRVKTWRQLAN